jgi:hypothetical protein
VLFDGFVSSQGLSITRDQASFQVPLIGWLARLDSGSILFDYANVADPRAGKHPMVSYGMSDPVDAAMRADVPPAVMGQLVDKLALQNNSAELDLWARGWKYMMAKLLTNVAVKNLTNGHGCVDAVNRPSSDLVEALERIEGNSQDLGTPLSRWAKPLAVSSPALTLPKAVQTGLFQLIADTPLAESQASTAWERLLQDMVGKLDCVVVPRIETAIVAPYLPDGIASHEYTIRHNEIYQVAATNPIRRPLRATAVMLTVNGVVPQAMRSKPLEGVGVTCYSPTIPPGVDANEWNASRSSKTMFLKPPAYLAYMNASAIKGMFSRVGAAGANTHGGPPKASEAASPEERDLENHYSGMLYNYAKSQYHRMQRDGQSVTVATCLRFDISPGSSVLVSTKLATLLGENTANELWQGYVNRVSYGIDVTTKTGTTVFQLQHVRPKTPAEDAVSLDRHPLYLETFTGATMTDKFMDP